MSRELRPRKSRPSYAAMLSYDDYEHGLPEARGATPGPSTLPTRATFEDSEGDSGSEFAPEEAAVGDELSPDIGNDVGFTPTRTRIQQSATPTPSPRSTRAFKESSQGKGKTRAKKSGTDVSHKLTRVQLAPGLSRLSNRHMYTLPVPSMHHRHRAVALFLRSGRVERLESSPPFFGPAKVVLTNNFTHNASITDRLNKAWGYNVGSGPLWELMEDRGWYKEALPDKNDVGGEANRRPIVYENQRVLAGWAILNSACVPTSCFDYI